MSTRPAIRLRWSQFDYVVRSNLLADHLYELPKVRQVFDHSRLVTVFQSHGDRIEIRRVIKPRRAAGSRARRQG